MLQMFSSSKRFLQHQFDMSLTHLKRSQRTELPRPRMNAYTLRKVASQCVKVAIFAASFRMRGRAVTLPVKVGAEW